MMQCPKCSGTEHRVLQTDPAEGRITRRRQCDDCGARFTTSEVPIAVFERAREVEQLLAELKRRLGTLFPTEG
jgi:transcriptional regulator NrdR family protein